MRRPRTADYKFPRITSAANMATQIMIYAPENDTEALKLLRTSFSDSPLSARVAALNLLIRRKARAHAARAHSPR